MSRLLFVDAESTGLDPDTARIVQLAIIPEGEPVRVQKINPEVPIPPEATAVHEITDADVTDAPTFRQFSKAVQALVDGAVLVTYNGSRFDVPLIDAELRRAGQPGLERDDHGCIVQPEIDLYQLWVQSEPRKLVDAVRRFLGRDLEDAHSADADASALADLLPAMGSAFGKPGWSPEELAECLIPAERVDRAGKFKRREDGEVLYNFGKHFGTSVLQEPSYLEWMQGAGFAEDTKAWCARLLAECQPAEVTNG